MKSLITLLIALLFLIFSREFSYCQLPKINVSGNKFVNENGEKMVFRGVNASDPGKLSDDGHWNGGYFEEAKKWGANIIRFPIHPVRWRSFGKQKYTTLLDSGVHWATEHGMYVVLDWHSIGNLRTGLYQNDMYDTDLKETFQFWRAMSKHFKGNTTVAFFELYNEPTTYNGELGTCAWDQWKTMMEELIGVVRANGSEAIPLIAGFNWAYDLTEVEYNPINAEGIAYVSHPYPQKRDKPWEEKWTADWGFAAEKYPLMLTEVGFCGPDDRGAHIPVISDESYGDALVEYCDARDISYVVWVFDPNWSPMLFSDWNFTPTRQGRYFKKVLSSYTY